MAQQQQDLMDYKFLSAILLEMMGGSVTLSEEEVDAMKASPNSTITWYRDNFDRMIVKVEE